MKVRIHPLARKEMRDAITYYTKLSDRLPARLAREFEEAIEKIKANPRLFYFVQDEWRKCSLNKFPYGLIYREAAHEIQVIAVAHHKRRPRYWAQRTLEQE